MQLSDAVDMLAGSAVASPGPTVWADLGCGDGTFTIALASLLAAGSTIHAVDRDDAALLSIPAAYQAVRITTRVADMTTVVFDDADVNGILMVNSLHYVRDQAAFLRRCASQLPSVRRFLLVEYDTDIPNRWVPYPVSRRRLADVFAAFGDVSIRDLASRPSIYQRAPLYSSLITPRRGVPELGKGE